jgi:hypothetical protein
MHVADRGSWWCMGIPIHLRWTFLVLLMPGLMHALTRSPQLTYIVCTVLLYEPILFVTIVVHELGHAWMHMQYGKRGGGLFVVFLCEDLHESVYASVVFSSVSQIWSYSQAAWSTR